jgi:hypothetical protein
VLRLLAFLPPALLLGASGRDYVASELVCAHVFNLSQELPAPLTRPAKSPKSRGSNLFTIGLPELILCRSQAPLLERFPYFWPLEPDQISGLPQKVQVLLAIPELEAKSPARLGMELAKPAAGNGYLALIFVMNDATRGLCAELIEQSRIGGVKELLIFKDPSKPPYLCSLPHIQKGFKRKPPHLS